MLLLRCLGKGCAHDRGRRPPLPMLVARRVQEVADAGHRTAVGPGPKLFAAKNSRQAYAVSEMIQITSVSDFATLAELGAELWHGDALSRVPR